MEDIRKAKVIELKSQEEITQEEIEENGISNEKIDELVSIAFEARLIHMELEERSGRLRRQLEPYLKKMNKFQVQRFRNRIKLRLDEHDKGKQG